MQIHLQSESHSVVSDSLRPHGLHSPGNSPGQNTGVGSLSLLQGTFPTQGLNSGLLHCRQILYQLSHRGSSKVKGELLIIMPGQKSKWRLFPGHLVTLAPVRTRLSQAKPKEELPLRWKYLMFCEAPRFLAGSGPPVRAGHVMNSVGDEPLP